MPKEEWGVKRICPSCSTRFYDLRMDPLTCPNCGASFSLESLTDSKPKALRPEKAKPAAADEVEDLPDIEETDDVIDGDDDLDDDLLEDDDDNVSLDEIADVGGNDDDE
ncbi:MAG: TIGR02300 family protein [Rhodobacteraceae bacterium]|uniref:TIGR02300 family protein n=1 Tax=Amaricoccus sp. B4 TaxID=3368557 RepID=UPI000DAF10A8|nr:TIGR02300 family protein [Paracoccaceae bacterium]